MTSSAKIFRPWASVSDETAKSSQEVRNSAFTRVPEPGHPASEFSAIYDSWNGLPIAYDDWMTSLNGLPLQTPENFVQNLSYLDPAYVNMAFPEIYAASSKMTKLKQRPKKFRCPHCKVSFSNNGQLKGHVRIHTGERPFKCDSEKCGKSFTRNEELTRHKRIHTGLRPFPCEQCGKRFGRKDHLKKHIRTHFPQPRFLDTNLVPLYPILFGY